MFKNKRSKNNNDLTPLFTAEPHGSVTVLTFCDRAADLLGMNLDAMDQLWHFFSKQERNPSKVIVSANLSPLEKARKQLANARKELALIQEANQRDGVWNEHVFHIESSAEKLIEKLEKKIASLAGFS